MLNNNLLILSDGILGEVAFEIAKDLGCYGEVALLDDLAHPIMMNNSIRK